MNTNNTLPKHMQDRYEVRDGFIINKGCTDPVIFAAMESIKADMLREAQERKEIREGRRPLPRYDNWGVWNISDRH